MEDDKLPTETLYQRACEIRDGIVEEWAEAGYPTSDQLQLLMRHVGQLVESAHIINEIYKELRNEQRNE